METFVVIPVCLVLLLDVICFAIMVVDILCFCWWLTFYVFVYMACAQRT